MNDDQLLRYSRHILLPELGLEGQERISASRVLVVGAGGLGSPAALYLASAGVGTIVLADEDAVDLTNLQRQIMHATSGVGRPKVESGRETLLRLNPEVDVVTVPKRLHGGILDREVARCDAVLDCTDNFATRHAINRSCIGYRKPLIAGAAIRFDGQISVYDVRTGDSPCYACVFPEEHPPEETRCAVMGVFAPVTGVIGTLQATEALKVLAGIGDALTGRLLLLDALAMEIRTIRVPRDPACTACAAFRGAASQ